MRLTAALAILVLAAALLAGCGSSDEGTTAPPKADGANAPAGSKTTGCVLDIGGASGLQAIGVSCGKAQKVALAWRRSADCAPGPGASRAACAIGGYRCLTARTGRRLSVACAGRGRAVGFTVKD